MKVISVSYIISLLFHSCKMYGCDLNFPCNGRNTKKNNVTHFKRKLVSVCLPLCFVPGNCSNKHGFWSPWHKSYPFISYPFKSSSCPTSQWWSTMQLIHVCVHIQRCMVIPNSQWNSPESILRTTKVNIWAFHQKLGYPKRMVKIMENSMNKLVIWGVLPLFLVQHP